MKIQISTDQKSRIQAMFLVFIIVIGIFLAVTVLLPTAEKERLRETSNDIPKPKIASEDENIDSFNINPKGGRWNVSLDDTTIDTIQDSNLKLSTVNNDTSGSNGFSMNRNTEKTDAKISYRSKTESGSNYTEFSRDTIGNSWDFEENNDNWISLSGSTVLAENGILTVSRTSADSYWGITLNIDLELPTIIYNILEIKAKGETVPLLVFQFVHENGSTTQAVITGDLSNDWEIFTLDLTDISPNIWKNFGLVKTLNIYSTDPNSFLRSFSLEYIKLIGDLDFATYTDDTWDFDNSNEFFYDELNDISNFDAEYFTINELDIADFTEDLEDFTASFGETVILDNGWLNVSQTDDWLEVDNQAVSIDTSNYDNIAIEFYSSVSVDIINVEIDNGTGFRAVKSDSTGWASGSIIFTADLSLDADWLGVANGIRISLKHTAGGSWSWKMNYIYLYKDENWNEGLGNTVQYQNNTHYLTSRSIGNSYGSHTSKSGLSIDSSIYKWLTFEITSYLNTIDYIEIEDSGTNRICIDNTNIVINTITLFSCDLSLDADYTGTETSIVIKIYGIDHVPQSFSIGFIYLYDVELGDIEDWAGADFYIDPNGYLTVMGAGGTPLIADVQTGDIIDSSLFTHLKLKIRAIGNGISGYIKSRTGAVQKTISPVFNLNSNWNESIIDLTLDSDWTENDFHDLVGLAFTGADDGEYIQIDYWLLLGHYENSESSIGLINPVNDISLVNITSYYYNSVNTTPLQYKIELYDINQEIAYYYYENFTDLNNEYIRGRFDYNTLESEFKFQLYADNDTRLINIQFPLDFEIGTGNIPVLFDVIGFPRIHVTTFIPAISYHILYVDYINAPFSERQWLNTDIPTDSDWITNSYHSNYVQGTTSDNSKWEIYIAELDSLSFDYYTLISNLSDLTVNDLSYIYFSLYAIDWSNGDRDLLFYSTLIFGYGGVYGIWLPPSFYFVSGGSNYWFNDTTDIAHNPLVSFTMNTKDNRDELSTNIRFYPDKENDSLAYDIIDSIGISDLLGYTTTDFVLEIEASIYLETEATFGIDNFDLVSRDIFSDLLKPITDPIADQSRGLFDWIGAIFRSVGLMIAGAFKGGIDWLLNGITGLVTIVTNALTTLGNSILTGLTSLGSTITSALTTLSNAITGVLNTVVTELQGLAAAIISGIDSAFTTIIDGLEGALDTLLSAIDDVLDDISGFIQDLIDGVIALADQIWQGFIDVVGDVVDAIITWLVSIVEDLVDLLIAVVDWIIDAMGLRDLVNALLGLIATTFDGLVFALTIIYSALLLLIDSLKIGMYIIVAIIFIYIIIIPLKTGLDIFDAIDRMLDKAFINLLGDTSILGFTIPAYLGFIEFGLIFALLTAEGVIV